MTISYTDPGEAGKLPYWYFQKRYEVPEEEITPRVARLLAIHERPKHQKVIAQLDAFFQKEQGQR